MNNENFPRIQAVRRIGTDLVFATVPSMDIPLYPLLSSYTLGEYELSESIAADNDLLIYAENFDPFTADTRHLATRLKVLEHLLEQSDAHLVIKTSSPLILLASPLLKSPRITTLFLAGDDLLDQTRYQEFLLCIQTLSAIDCKVAVIAQHGLFQSYSSICDLRRRLCNDIPAEVLRITPMNSSIFPKRKVEQWAWHWACSFATTIDTQHAA